MKYREGGKKKERERERETDRQTERQTDRHRETKQIAGRRES